MHIGQITISYNFKFLKNKYISNKILNTIQKPNYTINSLTKKIYIPTTSTKTKPQPLVYYSLISINSQYYLQYLYFPTQ